MLRPFTLLLLFLVSTVLFAQRIKKPQFNKWVFVKNASIDFNTGAPVFADDPSSLVGVRSSASYCDGAGNIILHSNGSNIFDGADRIIYSPALDPIVQSVRDGMMFVPFVGDPTKIRAFQPTHSWTNQVSPENLYYHEIDMSLVGANGSIGDEIPGQVDVLLAEKVIESVIAIMHENGEDYWVITRKHYYSGLRDFLAFLVTEDGVCHTPVVSSVGKTNLSGTPGACQMRASFDGKQFALTGQGIPAQLFDFDNCTGKVSNPVDISSGGNGAQYDIAFSPDDQLIYMTAGHTGTPQIFQYQRFNADIPSTEIGFGPVPKIDSIKYYDMRVYGDTIYIAGAECLHRMTTPNVYGNPGLEHSWHCNPPPAGIPNFMYSFPNYFDYTYTPTLDPIDYTDTIEVEVCSSEPPFRIGNLERCTSDDFSYLWSPAIGLDDPTAQSPTLDPSAIVGSSITYRVTVTFLCETYTDSIKVTVTPTNYPPTLTMEICAGDSALIFGNFETVAATYRDTVDSTCTINSIELIVSDSIITHDTINICQGDSALIDGAYYKNPVVLSDTAGCMVSFTHLVVTPSSSSLETVSICDEDSALIHDNFEHVAGTYTQINNCDTSNIILEIIPINTINSTVFICEGESYELENNFYTTSQTLLSTTDANCDRQQIELIVHPMPSVSMDAEHDFCDEGVGNVLTTITSGAEPFIYTWNTGDSTADIESLTAGTYSITINDDNNCSNTQTVEIENVCDASPVYFPTAFTPNENGINETFGPHVSNLEVAENTLSFWIFDRWGAQIFYTQTEGEHWDGTFEGELVPDGIYNYVFEVKQQNGNEEWIKAAGIVTVVR